MINIMSVYTETNMLLRKLYNLGYLQKEETCGT